MFVVFNTWSEWFTDFSQGLQLSFWIKRDRNRRNERFLRFVQLSNFGNGDKLAKTVRRRDVKSRLDLRIINWYQKSQLWFILMTTDDRKLFFISDSILGAKTKFWHSVWHPMRTWANVLCYQFSLTIFLKLVNSSLVSDV